MSALPCPPALWPAFSRLLDAALELPPAERAPWLAALAPEHRELAPYLAAVLAEGDGGDGHEPLRLDALAAIDALAALDALDALDAIDAIGAIDAGDAAHDGQAGPSAGDTVGPYRLVRELGRGGMGEVWLARRSDGAYEREVALKLPHAHLSGGSALRRFRRERDILASLSHPNIAPLYDAGVTADGRPYLALELVDGEPITAACRATRASLPRRVALVRQVAAAVAAAHARLVVHRDLKPSNVLVTAAGEVKLLDFGIAKLLESDDSEAGATHLTMEGARVATPDYAAPEQLTGAAITVATDVYALGLLLYELLAGRLPFDSVSAPARLLRVVGAAAEAPPASSRLDPAHAPSVGGAAPSALARSLAGDLDAILAKALAPAPDERYPSAAAFADDLARWELLEPVRARRIGRLARAAKFARRHRASVALAAALTIATSAGISGVLWQSAERAREAERANATRDFLVGVFKATDPRVEGDRPPGQLTVRELLDAATRRLEGDAALDAGTRSEIVDLIATIYAYLDETDAARELAARGTAALAGRLAADDPQLFDARFFEIWMALQAGDFGDAERRLARIDRELSAARLDRSRHRAEWHLANADVATERGEPERRKSELERAVALYEVTAPRDRGHAAALSNLGEMVLGRGEPRAALSLFERARTVALASGNDAGTDLARIDSRRGDALLVLGKVAEARAAFAEARRRFAGTLGVDHPTAWRATAGLAAALHGSGDDLAAAELWREIESAPGWDAPENRGRRADAERLRARR